MAKAVEQIKGLTVGHAALGFRGGVAGSVRQQVHDGDTINVRTVGNFGVRFLGVDAPEISFTLPGETRFRGLADPAWQDYLANPFATPFNPPLGPGLLKHLKSHIGRDIAMNHYRHAVAAERALEGEVGKDLNQLGKSEEDFRFFLAFAFEVIDRYGRLLCYMNREQPDEPRPLSYNERMLRAGVVTPYFIWPNVNPFRKNLSISAAVLKPRTAKKVGDGEKTLRQAREWVRKARQQKSGIFDKVDPLRLQPFEVRFLARRRPPDRWVIDLSKNDGLLIQPQNYYTIPDVEDRLFIPEEYMPLFVEAGWRRQS